MPVMDGYAASGEIRRREASGENSVRTPIVALTVSAMTGDRERCLAAGMDNYVGKPIEAERLTFVLEEYLLRDQRPAESAAAAF